MKKLISILLTAAMLTGNAAMPFTAIAADTAAEEHSLEAKETQVKNMEQDKIYALQSDPTAVSVEDYEHATLNDVFTELCGGEHAGAGNNAYDFFMHRGVDERTFIDKNGKLHKFFVLYPEVVVQMKEGVKLPIDKISNALADKGYKAPKLANEGNIYRLFDCTSKDQFNSLLDMLQKLPDAVSVTGHLAVYEDTANSIMGGGVYIGLPYEMDENNENYKELIEVASSVGYVVGTDVSPALRGDYQLFLHADDAENRTNPYKLFKYLEDNGYIYAMSITSTCLASLSNTVYFCNVSYPMNNEAPADLGNDTFNKLRDLNADTFRNVFRYYNIAPRYAFSEYDNIDDALASKYLLSDYYVVEHTDGWFSFYNEELKEYKTVRSTIIDGNEVKLPFADVREKAYAVYQDDDFASKYIAPNVSIASAYFLSGESSHMGTAVYLKTSAGDYVYYTNYDIGEVIMPVADFCKLQKIIREELAKHPDQNDGGGSVDLTGIYDLEPYRLKSDDKSDEDIDFTKGTKTMTLDDVKEIAKKKKNITWSDFADFKGDWNSIDAYSHMCRFELEDGYYLIVEGNPPEAPDVLRLYHKDDPDFIDLRYHNVNKYISEQFLKNLKNMSEEELTALFTEKGMTEEKGYRVWTKETAPKALENYYLKFLVKLPASFTDSKGNTIINETSDAKELSKMADDNSFDEQLHNFLGSFNVDITSQFAMTGHFEYRSEGSGDAKVYRRYIVMSANGTVGNAFTRDEAYQMLAGTLNFIQFSPQFAGFEYESRIPCYGAEDTGKLKGDANNDGQVDMADVVFIMQSLANPDKYELSAEGRANADIDGDGVTVGDAQSIQKHLLGIIDYITDLDTIRTMISDFVADQMIHITVVPKEKMPEQFADKYVFVNWNAAQSDGLAYDEFLRKNYITRSLIRSIPYDVDDDSELNKVCEKLYLYALENNIGVGVYRSGNIIRLVYDWRYEEDNKKMEKFIKDNNIDPDTIHIEILE